MDTRGLASRALRLVAWAFAGFAFGWCAVMALVGNT